MFNPERLSLIVQPIGDGGIRFYSYPTDDAEATVTAAGYATNAADYGLRTYDLIFVTPVNGAADTYILAVDAIDADGHATLASPGPIGDLLAANNLSDLPDVAAALVNLGGLTYIRGSDKVTPYDYGASSSDAYSTDHAVAVQAMVDAARATYDTDTNTFKKVIDLAGRMWTVGTSINLTNLRQVGLVIKNGGLHGKCAGRPVISLAGTQGVRFENVFISGDETDTPSCAVLLSRALFGAVYTGGAGLHDLTGLETNGMFLYGSVLNLGAEDVKYPIRTVFNRRKGTLGGSSVFAICADYAYFDTWFGTNAVLCDYATLPPTGTKLSCLGHEWLSVDARRPSPWGAPAITSITQAATGRLTLTTAPSSGATSTPPDDGDATFFTDIAGMTELNGQLIYLNKISDTVFDLYTDAALTTPLDTTGYGAFSSGNMWGASGPVFRFGGWVNNVHCPTGYALNYGWAAAWFDSRHETGASSGMTNVTLGFQHEAEPRWTFFAITPASVTVVYEDFDLEVNGIGAQNWAHSCFHSQQNGTGKITFRNSKMRFQNMTSAPPFGVFSTPTTFNMKNVELTFGLAAAWDGETAFNTPFTGIVHTDDDGMTRGYGEFTFRTTAAPTIDIDSQAFGGTWKTHHYYKAETTGAHAGTGRWATGIEHIAQGSTGASGAANLDGGLWVEAGKLNWNTDQTIEGPITTLFVVGTNNAWSDLGGVIVNVSKPMTTTPGTFGGGGVDGNGSIVAWESTSRAYNMAGDTIIRDIHSYIGYQFVNIASGALGAGSQAGFGVEPVVGDAFAAYFANGRSDLAGTPDFQYLFVHSTNRDAANIDFHITGPKHADGAGLIRAGDGTTAKPAYSFDADDDCGMFRSAANTIAFATNGVTRLTMDGGNVRSPLSLYAHNATVIPAGGTAGAGFRFSSTANFGVFFGSGAPTLSAAKGSLYLRSDGTTTNNRAYINTDSATTWTALTTAA